MKQSISKASARPPNQQRGGTLLGFILGLLLGLGSALAVAVYITNVPVPFLNKIGSRNASQDAKEAEHNRNWDPNAQMQGRSAKPTPPPPAEPNAANAQNSDRPAPTVPSGASATTNPSASTPSTTDDPLGKLAIAKANAPSAASADGFEYFVQAGAFRTESDADAQRARLAILGWEARISERDQNGRSVFRVRVGPFSKRDEAEALKEKLTLAKVDSTLMRVQR
jgi:cell division protein FtsN